MTDSTRTVSGDDITRRAVLKGGAAVATGAITLMSAPVILHAQSGDKQPIKFGLIEDYSGIAAYQGLPKLHATQLAIEEINNGLTLKGGALGPGGLGAFASYAGKAPTMNIKQRVVEDGGEPKGKAVVFIEEGEILEKSGDAGLLGRKIELVAPDAQSDNRRYQALARRLVQDDKVSVVMGAGFSSSREAIRPILNQAKMLYVYNSQYEGGVADKYTFCTGAVPEQQVIPVLRYLIDNFGPKFYTIAADYNFGQLTAMWARAVAASMGGKMIGQEFIPLQVSQFSSTISNIQAAKPDWLFVLLSGENHTNYYPQARAAGLSGIPMGATTNMMQGYEHIRFAPPAISNMHNAVEYMEEIPTVRNEAFAKRFRQKFPDEPYINELSQLSYLATHLWAKAVREARSTETEAVIKILESGIGVEAPEGWVLMDPATHHVSHTIRLAKADDHHNISFVKEWPDVEPWWTRRLGVNLVSRSESKQYTPEDDPILKKFL
jgi:branched-chain amino acid transport system substrate-binding protein